MVDGSRPFSATHTDRDPPTSAGNRLPLASFSDYLWPLTDPPTLTSSVPFPQAIPITDNAFWEQIFEAPGDKAEKYYGRTVSAAMRTSDPASPSPFLAAVNSQQSRRG